LFSFAVNAQSISADRDSLSASGAASNPDIHDQTNISKLLPGIYTYNWEVYNITGTTGWDYWICLDVCYPPNQASGTLTLDTVGTVLSCHCLPNNTAGAIEFDFKLTHTLNPLDTTIVHFKCDAAVSNIENVVEDFVKIYPNPTSNTVTINMVTEQIDRILLFNTQGQKIAEYGNLNATKHTFNTNNMVDGNYLVKVVLENGNTRYSYLNKAK